MVEQLVRGVQQVLQPATEEATIAEQQAMQHMANAVNQQQVMPDLMKEMVKMMQQMQTMQAQMLNNQPLPPNNRRDLNNRRCRN